MSTNTRHAKHVLITGAGSGIGRGMALDLAKQGHVIAVTDLHRAAAEEVKQLICEQGGTASAHALDVCSDDSVAALFSSLEKPVDVLINSAGIQHVERIETFPQEKWNLLNGCCRMTRAALKDMRANEHGRIINMGSIHSLIASPYKSAYVAAKHGLLGFSKTIALETADTDITINTICPSYVKTALVEKQIANQAKEQGLSEDEVISEIMLKPMPKHAFIAIEEISATAAFLMQDTARNITGQEIVIDGGWCIH